MKALRIVLASGLICCSLGFAKLASLGVGNSEGLVCSLPVTHTYTPGSPGSGSEPVCVNASSLTAEGWGPGAAGGLRPSGTTNGGGGGGGGYSKSILSGPFSGGSIPYSLGVATTSTVNSCVDGGNATATTIGGVVGLTANGGSGGLGATASTGGNGGTASGGNTTNTTGGAGATGTGAAGAGGNGANGGTGGTASSGSGGGNGTAPGAGGGGAADSSGCNSGLKAGDGAAAQVKFTWS